MSARFIIRADGRVERLCKHGTGHPVGTVVSVPWQDWMGVHGCCGCCCAWAVQPLVEAAQPFAEREGCDIGVLVDERDNQHVAQCEECQQILALRRALAAMQQGKAAWE